MRYVLAITLVLVATTACSGANEPGSVVGVPAPQGPPRIRDDVVARHAQEFDEDLSERPAGSQEEFAASAYLTAHLQQAGYIAHLEPVPVADLVRSTDVIAVPPGTEEPVAVVAIGYDTAPTDNPNGRALGMFLELARAALAADPDSSVWFAALGAQQVQGAEFSGSKVLLRYLTDEGVDPLIILLLPDASPLSVAGPTAHVEALVGEGRDAVAQIHPLDILGRDYDALMVVSGRVDEAGGALFRFLRDLDVRVE